MPHTYRVSKQCSVESVKNLRKGSFLIKVNEKMKNDLMNKIDINNKLKNEVKKEVLTDFVKRN